MRLRAAGFHGVLQSTEVARSILQPGPVVHPELMRARRILFHFSCKKADAEFALFQATKEDWPNQAVTRSESQAGKASFLFPRPMASYSRRERIQSHSPSSGEIVA
jgi:hypothetical protein